jgi:hypothetical protein
MCLPLQRAIPLRTSGHPQIAPARWPVAYASLCRINRWTLPHGASSVYSAIGDLGYVPDCDSRQSAFGITSRAHYLGPTGLPNSRSGQSMPVLYDIIVLDEDHLPGSLRA